ncbi:MAG: alpha/beta hydrolase [Phenylobacterium sp.]
MDFMTLETRAGPLGVVGRVHTGAPRPALVVVNGAFPPKGHRHDMVDYFSGVSVLVIDLPGMGGVPWGNPTLPELTEGLEQTLRRLLGDVPLVIFGSSTSNLVTLGLRLPNICRQVAQEPFFQTAGLWPFIASARKRMANNPANKAMARFFWEVFGIAPDRVENRDYRHLLQNIAWPTDVMVGGAPLEPERDMEFWPSFTSAEDRAALRAHPMVNLYEGPPHRGHSFGAEGQADLILKRMIHAALREAAKLCR